PMDTSARGAGASWRHSTRQASVRDAPTSCRGRMLPDEQRAGPDATGAAAMPVPAVRARTLGLVWWLAVAIVAADQLTKWLVQSWLPPCGTVSVLPGFVDVVHIHNAGGAFGFLLDLSHPYRSAFTTVLALGAVVAIAYYARQVQPGERLA